MPYAHVVDKPTHIRLAEFETDPNVAISKEGGLARLQELSVEMTELFDLMFYAGQHALLIVLQGMDTSGKDGTIRHLLNYSNAQSVKVTPFKVPTSIELAHDFLWRVHQQTPPKGGITIFNRSHYEDVLVVRVHELAPETVWKRRYRHINAFEDLVSTANTVVLKFFLNISMEEQAERLLEREQDVTKAWKLSVSDWKERELWQDYQQAYEDAIGKCASKAAPWHIVPGDKKWLRNLAVTEAIVESLRPLKQTWMQYLEEIGEKAKAELQLYRHPTPHL